MMSTLYAQNKFWIIYILVQISLLETALWRFSQFILFFLVFWRRRDIFTQSPHPTMEKLPTALLYVHSMVICSQFISIWCNDKSLNEIGLATFFTKQICRFLCFRTLWRVFHTLLTNTCSELKAEILYWYTLVKVNNKNTRTMPYCI